MPLEVPSDQKRFRFVLDAIRRARASRWQESRILDLGCGEGPLSFYLGALGCRYITGVDLDAAAIEVARDRCQHFGHRFEVGTLEATVTAQADGSWDAIICSEVLMHLADPWPAVAELRRLLAPDGVLIVTIPNGYGPWETYHRFSERKRYQDPQGDPPGRLLAHRFSWRQFLDRVTAAGLALSNHRNSNFLAGVYPFNVLGYRSIDFFERFDCWLADGLPAALASGWYFAFRPEPTPPPVPQARSLPALESATTTAGAARAGVAEPVRCVLSTLASWVSQRPGGLLHAGPMPRALRRGL